MATTGALDLPEATADAGIVVPTTTPAELDLPGFATELDVRTCELTMTATDEALGFGKDSAAIDPTGRSSLAAVARALTGTEAVRVVGHTSTEGDEEYNRSLSERRAHAVADVLRPDLPGASFEVIGAGETEPLVIPDDDEAGRAANRRVVITATVETEVCR